MNKFLIVCIVCAYMAPAQAQVLKKLKEIVKQTSGKSEGNTSGVDKNRTEIEKKEDAARDQYSDETENHEKPIFAAKVPANGKMVLKLKNGDRFSGGYIHLKGQPKKDEINPDLLEYINARVGIFFTPGEMSEYATYVDGVRTLNESGALPVRPEFFDAVKKPEYCTSTEGYVANQAFIQPTFTFKYNGKVYGPFQGMVSKMAVFKSMTSVSKTDGFFGIGFEAWQKEKKVGYTAIIQSEKKLIRIPDGMPVYMAEPTFPTGAMVIIQGISAYHFSDGRTIPYSSNQVDQTDFITVEKIVYGTDGGHVVVISNPHKEGAGKLPTATIDFQTTLHYPTTITKQHLLVATDPAKSVLYSNHVLYYPDGRKETIDNAGDAQLVPFNGKDYIVWFEMMKIADGHEIYVCQKELK